MSGVWCECGAVLEIDSIACPVKKRIIIIIRIVPKFEKQFPIKSESFNNNKDSTVRKTIKDSDKIGIF